ncbi:hypothetical protein QOZ80_7AG0582520 [Eleusine coracana subsp. coracana]|nr:hypothetical protein QOZ80_7AG0582520 [Eleusine coracana subsp. coracana]
MRSSNAEESRRLVESTAEFQKGSGPDAASLSFSLNCNQYINTSALQSKTQADSQIPQEGDRDSSSSLLPPSFALASTGWPNLSPTTTDYWTGGKPSFERVHLSEFGSIASSVATNCFVFIADEDSFVFIAGARTVRPKFRDLAGTYCTQVEFNNQTISFNLLPTCPVDPQNPSSWTRMWSEIHWAIPQSFRQEPTKVCLGVVSRKISRSIVLMEEKEDMVAPWPRLPVELLELLVPRLSFVDYMHMRAVCKGWSLISKPIQDAKKHPMLMNVCGTSGGMCRLFDPMVGKQYISKDVMFSCDNWQSLHFSKHGWVLSTKGKRWIHAVNPFTGEVCKLPKMCRQIFNGISFSSVPKSPDSVVFAIHKQTWQGSVDVMLWRAGDKFWTKEELPCETPFSMTYSNPVFFENEFYCLGVHGNLGVFNPDDMTWRILDKPEPIRSEAHDYGDRFCNLVEFKGDLLAVFRPYDAKPIEVYKLDRSQMSWTEVLRLDDAILFLDNWNATIKTSLEYGCCNRIYLPVLGYNEAEDHKVSVYYDLEDGKYKPGFYGLTEPINSIWVELNFYVHM